MAQTWQKRALTVIAPNDAYLRMSERRLPEGASQTFPIGAPLKWASGLLLEWVNPSDGKLVAISATAGQNSTGKYTQCYLLFPGLELEANFLGAAAADNVLAAADMGGKFKLAKSTTLLGAAAPGWYIEDDATAGTQAVIIAGFEAEICPPQSVDSDPAAGDTNARVRAVPLLSELAFYD